MLLRIQLLGGLVVEHSHRTIHRFQTSKTGSLLGCLAFHVGQDLTRDVLLERLWPSDDLLASRHCLSQAVYSLRRQLEPPGIPAHSVLHATHSCIRLNPAATSTDVAELGALLRQGEAASSLEDAVKTLQRAADLYRGDLLPGYYEDWVLVERERLSSTLANQLRETTLRLAREGSLERALQFALQAARVAPLVEQIHRDVMALLGLCGRHSRGLEHYDHLVRLLEREEDRKPESETVAIAEKLRAHIREHAAAAPAANIPKPRSRQLTARDLEATTACHADRAEAPRSTSPQPREAMPSQLTRFFGRDAELQRLSRLITAQDDETTGGRTPATDLLGPEARAGARLVVLVGPGGSGKTRLTEQFCASRGSDGELTAFVLLADVPEPQAIPAAILDVLGVRPVPTRYPLDQAVDALSGRGALLVLDNFEHLVDGGSEIVYDLLRRLPRLRVVVTSRQHLGIDGEVLLPVEPLPVPREPGTPERLLEFASIQLFVDRAQAVCADFQITRRNAPAIAAICRAVEGLPLAIELAAARAHVLTPAQILVKLTDRFGFLRSHTRRRSERHRTLRSTIAWSCDLLPPELAEAFTSLSVFRGGWRLNAAAAVLCSAASECRDPSEPAIAQQPSGTSAVDMLDRLVRRSLVVAEADDESSPGHAGMRYHMLEMLREYAMEQLATRGAEATADIRWRHAHYYAMFAEDTAAGLRGRDQVRQLALLDEERENIRAALTWALGQAESARVQIGIRLASAVWPYWLFRGHITEGKDWICRALDASSRTSGCFRARLLVALGVFSRHLDDVDTGLWALGEAARLAPELGDAFAHAQALDNLGTLLAERGDIEAAQEALSEALALHRASGDAWSRARSLNNLGRVVQGVGDLDEAQRLYREAYQLYDSVGDHNLAGITLNNLGVAEYEGGDLASARASFERALDLLRARGNSPVVAVALHNIGEILLRQGDTLRAADRFEQSLRERRRLQDWSGCALPLGGLGVVACRKGNLDRAVRLIAAADNIGNGMAGFLAACAAELWRQDINEVRGLLAPADFDANWNYGRLLSTQQAVAYALGEESLASDTSSPDELRVSS